MDEGQVPSASDETLDFDDDTLRGKTTNSYYKSNNFTTL